MLLLLFEASTLSVQAAENNSCFDQALMRLSIPLTAQASPQEIRDVIENVFKLDRLVSVQQLFEHELKEPTHLQTLIENVRSGIQNQNPALHEFICEALERGLIPELHLNRFQNEKTRRLFLAHLYVLEKLVDRMRFDSRFMEEVVLALFQKRKELGLGTKLGVYRHSKSAFAVFKTFSIDSGILQLIDLRKRQSSQMFKADPIRSVQLHLNILEAVTTEKLNGFSENAKTGLALINTPVWRSRVTAPFGEFDFEVTETWARQYEAWNMAFLLGNLDHLELLTPKLLIPSVLSAAPHEYLFRRVVALWLTIQAYLFAEREQRDPMISKSKELSKLLGKIAYRHYRVGTETECGKLLSH